jgi:sterol desaturase/sphingolipid hydroxylase (fatty acid hydroxylase superfamily)
MDAIGDAIVRVDMWFWHLSNVLVGVAVLVAIILYAPPGTLSLDLRVTTIDPFYVLTPLSILYTCWCGVDLWQWYDGDEAL